jgi:paraquat-inducible protein B
MTETSPNAAPTPLPSAVARPAHRSRIPLVWLVPALAAGIGAWLAIHAFLDHGPVIKITFLDAEGIEAGKTKLRYDSVDIGDVRAIQLASDGRTVEVTVETANFASPFLVSGSRFWIVRPRLGTTGISGLGTLLSGPYIAMDAGASKAPARSFSGLERPPVVAGSAQGRQFVLEAKDLGSLSVSSPAYFHHIPVGRISAIALNPDGHGVTVNVFIDSPYDRFVTEDTRFWHASGVDVDLDSSGIHVQSQSLTTILAGGIAFEAPPDSLASVPSEENSHFSLGLNRATAMKPPNGITESYVLYFSESLRGLAPGAVVDFRGVEIGEVVAINVQYQRDSEKFQFPVLINIYPERLQSRFSKGGDRPVTQSHSFISSLIEQGFRAQLRSASLLTGQLYVALDFFPRAAKVHSLPELTPMPLPTIPGNLEQVQKSLISVAQKLDELPLNKIAHDLDATLVSLHGFLDHADHEILPEAKSTLSQARDTLLDAQHALAPDSSLQSDVHGTLLSVGRAADSIRTLVDYLDKHPESLIRGKSAEPQ